MNLSMLQVPLDIPWQRIGVSSYMIDTAVCGRARPVAMQPSVAVFRYDPEAGTYDLGPDLAVTYLKVTCSITSYGVNNLDKLRNGRLVVSIPGSFGFAPSAYKGRKTNDFDPGQAISGADLPCFGALVEVSVGPASGNWSLGSYPYFSDFEPKKRELYEVVTETGEVMSRSEEKAGVLHGGTTSYQNESFDKDTVGVKYSTPETPYGKAEASYGHESGNRNVDAAQFQNVRTVDGSREARETYSHTTQLSQMYQLLSSFHLGTNRAMFWVEPRPHIVQRDRTFVDGPRQLEGIQEFFLVVARPKEMDDLCVNVSLETLHVGTTVDKDASDPNQKTVSLTFPRIGQDGSWEDPDTDRDFPAEANIPYPVPVGWVVDRFAGSTGLGYDLVGAVDQAGPAQYRIEVTDRNVTLWGQVLERHIDSGFGFGKDERISGHLSYSVLVYLRREEGVGQSVHHFAVLGDTTVCTCDRRRTVERDGPSIVREVAVGQTKAELGRPMEHRDAAEWTNALSQMVRSSVSCPDRYPRGEVGFWDLDIMKRPLGVVRDRKGQAQTTIGELAQDGRLPVPELRRAVREYVTSPEIATSTVGDLLAPSLAGLVESSGLTYAHAASLRAALWRATAAPRPSSAGRYGTGDSPAHPPADEPGPPAEPGPR